MNKDEYQFNGFTYSIDYEKDKGVNIFNNKKRPEYLFKFYSLSKFSVDAFTNNYLYASHPFELNDTLDSSKFLLIANEKLEFELYEKLIGDALSKEELEALYLKDTDGKRSLCKEYIEMHYDISTNLFGVISMTAKENNILMWPHYTQEKGFQVKFKTEVLENSIKNKLKGNEEYLGAHPINYCNRLCPINVSPYRTMHIPIFYITNIKSNKWEYEDEWRFIVGKQNMGVPYSKLGLHPRKDYHVDKKNRYIFYDKNTVEEITVGKNFFNGREFEIDWLNENTVKVKPVKTESNWEYENQIILLDYVSKNLSDNFYHCGTKYEIENEELVVVRTKERMDIKKLEDGSYLLTRTDKVIIFMD
ncbi:MAG: DUF2971 domain-containing protein [Bacteroidota bacterium]